MGCRCTDAVGAALAGMRGCPVRSELSERRCVALVVETAFLRRPPSPQTWSPAHQSSTPLLRYNYLLEESGFANARN